MSEDGKKSFESVIHAQETYGSWVKAWSKTYKAFYWHNSHTNEKIWHHPGELESKSKTKNDVILPIDSQQQQQLADKSDAFRMNTASDRPADDEHMKKRLRTSSDSVPMDIIRSDPTLTKVAIIVPFRDLHAEQKRAAHLRQFIEYMPQFFTHDETMSRRYNFTYRIYIIEQSNDKRRFNRGKLLNIGFKLAVEDHCNIFIFHDVDLLPSYDLLEQYITIPEDKHPIHIARLWNRYNSNPKYFGGIVSFTQKMFREIDGFPNNYWGWGGEDDDLYKRICKMKYSPVSPSSGSIRDLEEMTLEEKLSVLRAHQSWKCPKKKEVLNDFETRWREGKNGLRDLNYSELRRIELAEYCYRITVDVQLNNDWADEFSSLPEET